MGHILIADVLDGLAGQPDESFDAIIADPPYNIGKDFGATKDSMSPPEYDAWSARWMGECLRALKPTGTIFVYGFSETLARLSVVAPFNFRWLVWHYTNKTVPSLKFWQRSHESILCGWKDQSKRVFHLDAVRESYTDTFLKNAAGRKRRSTPGRFSDGERETVYTAHEGGALPRDVIEVSALAGGAGRAERWFWCYDCDDAYSNYDIDGHRDHRTLSHPTQKPYELTRRLLRSCTVPGNRVLVPFVGSGSECAVAEDLGLDYVGFEINASYVRLAEGFLSKRRPIEDIQIETLKEDNGKKDKEG